MSHHFRSSKFLVLARERLLFVEFHAALQDSIKEARQSDKNKCMPFIDSRVLLRLILFESVSHTITVFGQMTQDDFLLPLGPGSPGVPSMVVLTPLGPLSPVSPEVENITNHFYIYYMYIKNVKMMMMMIYDDYHFISIFLYSKYIWTMVIRARFQKIIPLGISVLVE